MAIGQLQLSASVLHTPQAGVGPTGISTIPAKALTQATTRTLHTVLTAVSAVNVSVDFAGIANARFIMIQQLSGSLDFKFTSSKGSDQELPVGRLMVWENSTEPVTAIKYSGTGEFELFLAEW